MPLVSSKHMLLEAQKSGYAIGAFNVENMEMVQAVISAAEAEKAPVMLQTTPSTLKYADPSLFAAMVTVLAHKTTVPVCLHLDHGNGFSLAVKALGAGYTSIMIDGSHECFEENISLTARVVEAASSCDIPVEAELGKVGGKEDDLDGGKGGYTNPEEAGIFIEKTGISSLAVAIGTAHGVYAGLPQLDVDRLRAIRQIVSIPLVLHGASGLTEKQVRDCIAAGICKVNFATELRIAYSNGVKSVFEEKPDTFDPKSYGNAGKAQVVELVKNRIRICGCNNTVS